ncbi:MAG: hypothetical protein AB7K52_13435 [Phycisphaerales bacterium]
MPIRPARFAIPALAFATFAGLTGLAPEPNPIPSRWELRVDLGPMRVTSYDVKGEPQAFAYMTYTVTNKSGQDLLFAPSFELALGGRPVRAGNDVPGEVTTALLDKINDPALQDQISMIGSLLNGEENARRGLVIWSLRSLDPRKMVVYAAGFSGETATIDLPSQDASDPKKAKSVLRKTLMVTYTPGGELTGRGDKPIDVEGQQWIMR